MFRFRFSGGYPFHGYPIWCYFLAAVKPQCGKKCRVSLTLHLELYVDVLIHLLTAVGMTPCDSSTVHIYTQTVHRTTQLICEECGPCPVFASYTVAFVLQLRKKHRKTSLSLAEECHLAWWKQIYKTYITIRIHKQTLKIHNLHN